MFMPPILSLALTSRNKTSRHEIKRYAEPWCIPFWRLKYDVAIPALMIQDFWLSSSTLTHHKKSWRNANFLRQASKKEWFKVSNTFSVSTISIYHIKLKLLLISNISDIGLTPSPLNLFCTYAVCWHDIKSRRVSFNLEARAFNMIL